MGLCFVPNCNHKSQKDGCSMLTFPKSPKRLAKWKKLIRRADRSPGKSSRICSCHFRGGSREHEPSIFAWNVTKMVTSNKDSPKKRSRGVAVRKLNFPSTSEGMAIEEGGVKAQGQDKPTNESRYTRNPEDLVLDTFVDVPVADKGDEPSVNLMTLHDRLANVEEENERLHSRLKELEPLVGLQEENARLQARIKEIEAKVVLSTSALLEAENYLLQAKVKRLEEEIAKSHDVFSFRKISHDNALVKHFTGLPNKETFFALLKLFDKIEIQYVIVWKVTRFEKEDQLFLTLFKLRRNPTTLDLGVRFKIDRATVTNIFLSWVMALHHVIFVNLMGSIPSTQKNQSDLPECFKAYPNTRIILDCTEVTTAVPTLLSNQNRMYSSYKSRTTCKALVGIAPNGTVVYLSKLFAGSSSDRRIVEETGILKCCVPGDAVMADKGFNITDIMPDGVGRNIPPFKHNPQFSAEEIEETVVIAAARIHVERAINRIKRFTILNFIPQFVVPYASEIFQVCGALTNFQRCLINCRESDEDAD